MDSFERQRTAAPAPRRGIALAWPVEAGAPRDRQGAAAAARFRSGVLMRTAPILLAIVLAAAALWLAPATAETCSDPEQFSCGPWGQASP